MVLNFHKSVKLNNKQEDKWDGKIHPKMIRFLLDNDITFEEIKELRK